MVMSPLEFMQRLAALVPRLRLHLIRFHGVLAPNAKLRALVVPQGPPAQAQAPSEAAVAAECEIQTALARPGRISWARRLLKRVFDIDLQHCPNCSGGEFKIIAAILERPVIHKILEHRGRVRAGRQRAAWKLGIRGARFCVVRPGPRGARVMGCRPGRDIVDAAARIRVRMLKTPALG